ncbi:MAG: CAP domain-containing protein [Robiginitomaculum sp.]|nr:CAP domain-containing protein [Robiginitomaculum sp.]
MSFRWTLKIIVTLILIAAIPYYYSNKAFAVETIQPDTGVYHTETVSSFDECKALCQADTKCRGMEAHQPDTRFPVMSCRLNNGFGSKSPFPNKPPETLNLNIALADLNAYRISKGLKPVTLNNTLNITSRIHAQDLANLGIISHTGSDGSGHGERLVKQGYKYSISAENVATGQKSWSEAFKGWQDSPGHNVNLLRHDVTEFGVALVYEPKTTFQTYWVMLVAAPLYP